MRSGLMVVLLAISAVVAAGCGGGSESERTATTPTAEEQVRAAATRLAATRNGTLVCTRLVTRRVLDDLFEGSAETCAKSTFSDAPEDGGTTKVLGVAVEPGGTRASVEVRQVGGKGDGLGGHEEFVREGPAWKLDRFELDYLRSVMTTSIAVAGKSKGTGALTEPTLRRCMLAHVETTRPSQLRTFIGASIRKDPKAEDMAIKLAEKCPDELATYVTNAIVKALVKDGKQSPAFVRCAKRQLRGFLSLTQLAGTALKGNTSDATTAALQGIAMGVRQNCKGK